MTANEPPNPYAPSAALAHDAVAAKGPRRPSRVLAAVTTFLAFPLLGAGFALLGRPRRLLPWLAVGVVLLATAVAAARLPLPRLCVGAFLASYLAVLLAIVHTAVTKPGDGYTGARAWLVALALVVGAKGGAQVIKYTLVEAFRIPSGAMVPTLLVGDHIFVKKGRHAARGDVIVFEFPADRSTDYIKRVVAVGGDTVQITEGVVSINGVALAQTNVTDECQLAEASGPCRFVRETNGGRSHTIMFEPAHAAQDYPRTQVPDGHVFVLGDNRDNSFDSRRWGFVPVDHIKGIPTMTWWSQDQTAGIRWSRVGRGVE